MIDKNLYTKRKRNRYILIGVAVIVALIGLLTVNRAGLERSFKTAVSHTTGGLNRTVTVYDDNGNELRTYKGKIDLEENDYGNKVSFDLDGKRHIVYNGVVIVDEE